MFEFIQLLFSTVWSMFQIPWPGFDFTIGSVFLGVVSAIIGLKVLGSIFGFSFSPTSILGSISGGEQKGGNNRNIKISNERKGDKT